MSAIDQRFAQLRASGRKAFIPFVTAGDPSLEVTRDVLLRLSACGCALGEVGIPYSDPIADGPVIQASYTRALDRGIRLKEILATVGALQGEIQMPLVSMVSYSIIRRQGESAFLDAAQAAGLSGAIVPDLLVDEEDGFRRLCHERDFSLIHLVTPTTPPERMRRIAEQSTGFIYFVSVTGITGERTKLPVELLDKVSWLRERTSVPVCIGFGISQVEHVRMLSPVADGLIVGSAFVRRLSESTSPEAAIKACEVLARELISAMDSTQA
ncbi:MAG: tryptophan synthase subunit alpha [Planctomycetales bacterium]|nr:tryptophan synthase subunit alpha [Planctomycetales bacterium]